MHGMTLLSAAALALGTLAVCTFTAGTAAAQAFSNKPTRLMVTLPPGGAPDMLARLFADKARLGHAAVVENKPRAGGNIGARIVTKARADGHTLVMRMMGLIGTAGTVGTVGAVGTHRINTEMQRIDKLPDVAERLKALGLATWISTPDELARCKATGMTRWAQVVKAFGVKAD